jgi:5-methyltetrahydropteroyltriglutamate--homocysteine methyltransferase
MTIPTEPIGSIPRPQKVITAFEQYERGSLSREEFESICNEAVRETIEKFEATGSPVITDGEQTKPSFATYPIHGLSNLNPGGVKIQFADGHVRQLPKLSSGPFRYKTYASSYLQAAKKFTRTPVKQAVISPSALSLLYPPDGIPNYPQEKFLEDLVKESATDIRGCLDHGAHCVQIDFTEGRLAVKLDPSGKLLSSFIALINRILDQFSEEERKRINSRASLAFTRALLPPEGNPTGAPVKT